MTNMSRYDNNATLVHLQGLVNQVNDLIDMLDEPSALDLSNFDGSVGRANKYCNRILADIEELFELFEEFNNWQK
jgi:hypothetical protein